MGLTSRYREYASLFVMRGTASLQRGLRYHEEADLGTRISRDCPSADMNGSARDLSDAQAVVL